MESTFSFLSCVYVGSCKGLTSLLYSPKYMLRDSFFRFTYEFSQCCLYLRLKKNKDMSINLNSEHSWPTANVVICSLLWCLFNWGIWFSSAAETAEQIFSQVTDRWVKLSIIVRHNGLLWKPQSCRFQLNLSHLQALYSHTEGKTNYMHCFDIRNWNLSF